MRAILIGLGLMLAACENPALQQMEMACEEGDLRACEAVLEHRRAASAALFGNRPTVYVPPLQTEPVGRTQTTTNCIPTTNGGFNCYSY